MAALMGISPTEHIPFTDALPLMPVLQALAPFVWIFALFTLWAIGTLTLFWGGPGRSPWRTLALLFADLEAPIEQVEQVVAPRERRSRRQPVTLTFGRKKSSPAAEPGLAYAAVPAETAPTR